MAVDANDKVTRGLLSDVDKGHATEVFKVYVAQLERAAAKYAVGSPVHTAYIAQIAEVKSSMERIVK